jgi:NADH-quinone oxidoreductase subunit L
VFQIVSGLTSIAGILLAYGLFFNKTAFATSFTEGRMIQFFYRGWGFDLIYDTIIVRPFVWLAEINKNDFIDRIYNMIARITSFFHSILSTSQNGRLRWYVMGLTAGLIILLTLMMTI